MAQFCANGVTVYAKRSNQGIHSSKSAATRDHLEVIDAMKLCSLVV